MRAGRQAALCAPITAALDQSIRVMEHAVCVCRLSLVPERAPHELEGKLRPGATAHMPSSAFAAPWAQLKRSAHEVQPPCQQGRQMRAKS